MENTLRDLRVMFENYDRILNIEGVSYGEMYTHAGRPIVLTSSGKKLLKEKPGIFLGAFEKPDYGRSPFASGQSGDVYRVEAEGEVFAEKRYRCREDGITQIHDMAKLSFLTKDLPRVRTPRTYYASREALFMELIEARTWEQFVKDDPKMEGVLTKSFYKSGGMRRLSQNNILVCNDSKLVKVDENGEYEFVLVDPVIR